MSYERQWDCDRCGKRQRAVDWPSIYTCDSCIHKVAFQVLHKDLSVDRAYELATEITGRLVR